MAVTYIVELGSWISKQLTLFEMLCLNKCVLVYDGRPVSKNSLWAFHYKHSYKYIMSYNAKYRLRSSDI
jgi:hypothetical protein